MRHVNFAVALVEADRESHTTGRCQHVVRMPDGGYEVCGFERLTFDLEPEGGVALYLAGSDLFPEHLVTHDEAVAIVNHLAKTERRVAA